MKWLLLISALLFPWYGHAAIGDLLGAFVSANGWMLNVDINGLSTNGTFSLGWGSNMLINGSAKVILTKVDMGFDDSGNGCLDTNRIYGEKECRSTNAAYNIDSLNGTNVRVTVALSQTVSSRASNLVLTVYPGWYSDGVNPAKAGTVAVTNSSLQPYDPADGTWRCQPWEITGGSNYTLRAVAYHNSARLGRPVRVIKFWATNNTEGTAPVWVTNMTVDRSHGDANPVCEYIATLNCGPITQGALFTNHFTAYPWVGDTPLTTTDGKYSVDTMWHRPLPMTCDKTGDYGTVYAIVDPTNGVNTGTCFTNLSQRTTATCFSNIGLALNMGMKTNTQLFGRSNLSRVVVLLTNGSFSLFGTNVVNMNENYVWATVTRHPDVSSNQVFMWTNILRSAPNHIKLKWQEVTFTWNSTASMWDDYSRAWWYDLCWFQTNRQGKYSEYSTNTWLTRCIIDTNTVQWLPRSDFVQDFWFISGNTFRSVFNGAATVFMGNQINPGEMKQSTIRADIGPITNLCPIFWVGNSIYNVQADSSAYALRLGLSCTNIANAGIIAQNLIEATSNTSAGLVLDISNSQWPTNEAITNLLLWNNTVLGPYHPPYDITANSPKFSGGYHSLNSIHDLLEGQYDETSPEANTWRTNRWNHLYSVNYQGNSVANSGIGQSALDRASAKGTYGIGSHKSNETNTTTYWRFFVASNSSIGVGSGWTPGGGDYRVKSYSPAMQAQTRWVLPYDLAGKPRGRGDPAGAYATAAPRRTTCF